MREHGEAVEADFQRYYHLDLLDLWRGLITPRKAAVLVTQLPAGAQTWVACGYDNAWTLTDHLTATLVDVLQIANWQRAGDSKAKRPTPVKRPHDIRGDNAKAERMDARARAFLERQKRLQRAETSEEA